ncbi:MAG: hypothetical protein NC201_02400 [Prevotella sp.]|nr:hypothetical protein [Bacteroides sp.]MCM1366077.1 hypothetical protein [Prevotella sp.]MCM1436562.1 hypothetical protein [Prevotella sp.]
MRDIKFSLKGIDDNITSVKFVYDKGFFEFSGLVYPPVKLYHAGVIPSNGEIVINSKENVISPFIDKTKEWVVYNPSDNSGNKRFFRIRFETYMNYQTLPYATMYMCEGKVFSKKYALPIAETLAYDGATLEFNDVEIPSEFWGTGFEQETFNPYHWNELNHSATPFVYGLYNRKESFEYYD